VFVVVSRQAVIDSVFSMVVCAPVYSVRHGLATQVNIGAREGLEHDSAIHCDELVSLPKAMLTDWISSLQSTTIGELDRALKLSLDLR
jgi:mRNA interferase MazF